MINVMSLSLGVPVPVIIGMTMIVDHLISQPAVLADGGFVGISGIELNVFRRVPGV